ncbi:MAG TPA: methyltransferase domain-containing protein [Candidatus Dormibacteraeota bacterium]
MARGEHEAQSRNEQLVGQMESSGALGDPAVADAFRAVLRHHFLPGRPLDEVYEDSAVMTKTAEHGIPISSSSQPAIMAIMLQLLQLLPGHRVLEIGAGTGYNAALVAHLVGRGGHVVTIDIEPDLVQQARANLAEAGVQGVEVVQGDGAAGWPAGAPFDRVIVTAGAHDLSPAWVDQLTEDGRIVLPLGLARPLQLCVALVRQARGLVSTELCPCGFMPLRGEMTPRPPAGRDPLGRWLAAPGRATGYTIPATDLRSGFGTWLALTHDSYVPTSTGGESAPGIGLRDDRGAALVSDDGVDDGYPVLVYGDGEAVGRRLIAAHREWTVARPRFDRLRISVHRSGDEPVAPGDARVVRRPHFTFVVRSA